MSVSEEDLCFIDSQRGKKILIHSGYKYNFEKENKNGTKNWRCASRDKCSTSICLDLNNKIVREPKHICIPQFMTRQIEMSMFKCKKRVCESLEPIPKIFEKEVQTLVDSSDNETIFSNLPLWKSKKSTLYNTRNKYFGVPKTTFNNLGEVIIPDVLAENFLVCNDGDTDKLLIFCSSLVLNSIQNVHEFYGDGTFKVTPHPFLQLYSIHGNLSTVEGYTNFVPLFYILLPDKSEMTYLRLFTILKEKFNLEIKKYKCDFEVAVMNSVKVVYPDVDITGCYFHYMKALWKKSKQLGLFSSEEGRLYTKLCTRLALLPAQFIPGGYLEIAENLPNTKEYKDFHDYFSSYWLKRITSKLFTVNEEEFRTTNCVEGWHNRLKNRIPPKTSLILFIKLLRNEANYQDIKIKQCNIHSNKKKRRSKDTQTFEQQKAIVDDFLNKKTTIVQCLSRLCET